MLATAITSKRGAQTRAASGKSGNPNARSPNSPALLCTPETIATSGGGDCVYVAGIQLWKGNAGVLTANAKANAPNNHQESAAPRLGTSPLTSKVWVWL